jgi:tetratricopeptide (TPR) repeat protein
MAGHLIHMPTHIDVLVGDYESCVRFNCKAIVADMFTMKSSPDTAGVNSFYFGYIVHNYHFAAYGAILGGMEAKAMEIAAELGTHLTEDLFTENPNLGAYLESYSALELHVMVRFGRWKDILEVQLPRNKDVMIFRTATIAFSRGLAYANMGDIAKAKKCADQYDSIRNNPIAEHRILHNNVVKNLLDVDAPMLRGEIAYHEGRYDDAFRMLRKAVELQDGLNYDEPWGKMQPIRHALGGLLLERNHLAEAADVFRTDLRFHPRNPFALVGLIQCLQRQVSHGLLEENDREMCSTERQELIHILEAQRRSEWADFDVHASCACCVVSTQSCS